MNRALRLLGLLLGVGVLGWLSRTPIWTTLIGVFPRIGWGFLRDPGGARSDHADERRRLAMSDARLRNGRHSAVLATFRWICEAINTTLPAAQIGGDVVRARLLQQRISAPARGAASVAVDFCITHGAEILFTVLGFVLLAWLSAEASWWPVAASAALLPAFRMLSWELLVRRRLLAALHAVFLRFECRRLAGWVQSLGTALTLVASSRTALARVAYRCMWSRSSAMPSKPG